MVRRQPEPVRVEVGADEAEVLHRVLEIAQALHAAERVDAGETGKAVGMCCADLGDALVGDLERTLDVQVARAHRDEQRALDAGAVHLARYCSIDTPSRIVRRHANLGLEISSMPV